MTYATNPLTLRTSGEDDVVILLKETTTITTTTSTRASQIKNAGKIKIKNLSIFN